MNRFCSMVIAKFRTVFFSICHGRSFRGLGLGAYIASPFNLDGVNGIELGTKTVFRSGAWLYCKGIDDTIPASLTFGKGCVFGYNNHIASVHNVTVGDYVLTANNVYISDNIHEYEDITSPIMHQSVKFKRTVSIGSGSWIGENVCVIGASIGRNCVIGANAVVTKNIPDYSVAVGNPAVVIKQYNFEKKVWGPCL